MQAESQTSPKSALPQVMGVVNMTPDSFSDGGRWASADRAADHAMRLVQQGADVLDIGGRALGRAPTRLRRRRRSTGSSR